jgi:predicted alpha/beta superfamily hydrolase
MLLQNQLVGLPHTEQHLILSKIVGDQFKISVALPRNYADTRENYPIVCLLDANIFFGLVTETAQLLQFGKEIPDCIIIGVGYPDDDQHLGLRFRDLTPTPDEEGTREFLARVSQDRKAPIQYWGSGEAKRFLAFLCQELIPYLHEQYRIDPEDSVLVGDSVGGLFALYTVFHQPEAFKRYVIGSPSIYHGDAITFDYEATYAKAHDDLPVTIFLAVGDLEAITEPGFAAMVSNVARLTEILTSRKYPGLKLTMHIFDNETHLSVIPATMSRGLRTVFEEKKYSHPTPR